MKPATFAARHQISEKDIEPRARDFLNQNKKEGNKTRPCSHPISKDETLKLAWKGESAAMTRGKFTGWLPLDFDAGATLQKLEPDVSSSFDLKEARRRHAVALCCRFGLSTAKQAGHCEYCICLLFVLLGPPLSALAGSYILQDSWRSFLDFVASDYKFAEDHTMLDIMRELDAEIIQEVEKRLANNVWMLSADGATSRQHRLVTLMLPMRMTSACASLRCIARGLAKMRSG